MNTATTSRSAMMLPRLDALDTTFAGRTALAVAASLFVAAAAHISIPLPFTPVPLTFSDLAVVLVGLALSPEAAFAGLALYLTEGAVGMPVFNPGHLGGVAQLFGPTGGYLMAYPASAALASLLFRSLRDVTSRFGAALAAAVAASTLLMVCGTLWLGFELHLAPVSALRMGLLPFLPGQIVKAISAAGMAASFGHKRRA